MDIQMLVFLFRFGTYRCVVKNAPFVRFARNSLSRMKAFSPTSLALTFDHLRDREKKKDLEESLAAEQRMQQR